MKKLNLSLLIASLLMLSQTFAAEIEVIKNPKLPNNVPYSWSSNPDGVCISLGFTDYVHGSECKKPKVLWRALPMGNGEGYSYGTQTNSVVVDRDAKVVKYKVGPVIQEISCARP